MTTTPNSSKFRSMLRRAPRLPEDLPPSRILLSDDLNLPVPRDILQPPLADVEADAFEMSTGMLKEAAATAMGVPYVGAVEGVLLQIVKIKGEVDLYRKLWEEVIYNVVKVADLVKHFSVSCQRHGLCDEATFPQNFIGTIKDLETELKKVVGVMSQCRGKTRFERIFEQFMKGLARNDMIKEIQKCDRQMNRMFDHFMVAMLMDIRFEQLVAGRAQLLPIPSVTIEEPQPIIPRSLTLPQPRVRSSSMVAQYTCSRPSSPVLSFPRPSQQGIFFGRDNELKTIIDLIFSSASTARIAILGPGGVGKTALAHAVLTHNEVVSHFAESRYLVPCEPLTSRDALLVALANSLSLLQPGTTSYSYSRELEPRVLSALGSEKCILCLDSFESPWDQPGTIRGAVEMLLADITALPSVTVLITMRGGERPKRTAWTLPMLPPLTNFPRDAAKRTWESLAGTCDEWAEKLIDAVDCLPLAVTLLGSLAEVSTAETLWERWQKENIALVEQEKGDKLTSLEFSIALSLESSRMAADGSSKRLLGILSLLPGGMPMFPSPEFRRLFSDIPDIPQNLNTLLKCSMAFCTADKRVQVNSLVRLYCEKNGLASPEDRQALRDCYVTLASHGDDDLSHELLERTVETNNMESVLRKPLAWTLPSEISPSPLNLHHHSQPLTLPSPPSLPLLPIHTSGRLRPFDARELPPVRDVFANGTQPVISMTRAALQSTAGGRAYIPAVSVGSSAVSVGSSVISIGSSAISVDSSAISVCSSTISVCSSAISVCSSAAPTTSAPPLFPVAFCTSSHLLTPSKHPDRSGGCESGGDGAIKPASTWWGYPKRKRTIPVEQTEGYIHTRSRAVEAIGGALGTAARIGHESLFAGVDLLQFIPVPGLELAGKLLLNIWDAVEIVETNRIASLRLTERCADVLISVRGEIVNAGYTVAEELRTPIAKLVEVLGEVHHFLENLGQRPFLKRYLRRDEILSSITACDTSLNNALGLFSLSIQIRTLKLVQANELQRQKETHDLLQSVSHLSPGLPVPLHLPPATLLSSPVDPESVRKTLHALRAAQNTQDRAHDVADLRQLMQTALATNDDVAMIEVLQIARSEMPEAIKTLQRALQRVVDDVQLDAESATARLLPLSPQQDARKGTGPFVDTSSTGASRHSADALDREFIETGIGALRRLSKGTDLFLPSWTITQYEIDLEAKVGVGFFSDVYRGTWLKRTVAVKVLAETTPRKIFVHEVEIWKSLYHPNVLELFGASSASGEPPWFLVSKYYPRGSLVKYLKGLSDADATRVDALKMIHEISNGMEYLHNRGVLHGDLKAANILVDNDVRCVISDFGQSEMKSEVYRISRVSQPRGTLRWQAPELMQGAQALTPEMDVYAFAICCVEILTKGALPWPLMDDDAVRHFVLNENMRPSLPSSNLVNGQLMNVIRASWDTVPSNRPSFKQTARDLKKQRAEYRLADV